MAGRTVPTREEIVALLRERNNWGRWGDGDERGAINLITDEKRAEAARLVRSGRAVSLSRDVPTIPGRHNPMPAQHWLRVMDNAVVDYYGFLYHGYVTTHVDALCHVWDEGGMWGGRDPKIEVTSNGARFGGIQHWRDGITTRGVLLDVPKHRGEPSVTIERPVHGWELEEIAAAQGVTVGPGDALVVHSGREAWQAANPSWSGYRPPSPGLHASCLEFLREHDVPVLVWDLMDAVPNEYGLPWTMHAAIFAFGVALVDNALVQPLAEACAAEGRYEFMLTLAPLPVVGGTGSPVNPIALL
ncbi:MAG: cyclase family protein [Dehalococcoidia bacterium]